VRLLDKQYAYVKRYNAIVNVLVRHGFGYLVDRFGHRPLYSIREKITGPVAERLRLLSEAERLRLAFEDLGPTFIKFGQILSTRHDLLPEEYIKELSRLQDSVPPFEYDKVRSAVEKELGKTIEELFLSFDQEPLAAASIGQVHRARLHNNEDVVVKVMRPGVEETIETDLFILMSMARFAEKHIKETKFFNPVGFVGDFSRVIRQELDYTHEAQNADRFYFNFRESPTVRIPKIYWKYTTKRIMTQEFMEGTRILDLDRIEAMGLDPKTISINISNAYLKMVFEDGFYHADPHPGNLLVSKDGIIIFLDFGMAGHVDPVLRDNLANLIFAMQKDDLDLLLETLAEIGLISDAGTESQQLKVKLEDFINQYYSLNVKFFDPTLFLRDLIDVLIKSGGKIPTNIMLLSKTLMLRDEISRKLDPEHNFAELTEPFIRKMVKEQTSASYILNEASQTILDFSRLIRRLPRRLNHILSRTEKGSLRIELQHLGLEEMIEELDIVSNRLAFSIIISGLIVGSSLIIGTGMSPTLLGVPLLGIMGFFIAGFMGLGILFSILRSGKW
jgi:ubiquinone biosynthesis protein